MFSQRYAKDKPARVRLALRLPKAFPRWIAAEPNLTGKAKPKTAPSNAGNCRPDLPPFARYEIRLSMVVCSACC